MIYRLTFRSDGGFYSSSNDLAKFGQAILSYKLIEEGTTKAWLKPRTHTSSLGISVGAPWEIGRANNLTVDGRVVDIYSKIGGLTDYNTWFMVIPDYGLTFSLVSAGPKSSLGTQLVIATEVLKPLVRAFEAASKAEANITYAGTYANSQTNSSITLEVDDESGLYVQSWIMNGHDILETYPIFSAGAASYLSVRLFPTGLESDNSSAWRAVYNNLEPSEVPAEDELSFMLQFACHSWELIDNIVYGYNGLDDFVFGFNGNSSSSDGVATSITPRAFRQTLTRV